MKRQLIIPALTLLALGACAPATAQWGRPGSSYGVNSPGEVRRVAYDRGFREGVSEGERDGRNRDAFRYRDERDFQRADIGYHRSYGDPDRYRQAFRSGFVDGYAQGYRRYARTSDRGRYDDGRYGRYPQRGGQYYTAAFDFGARDGYEKGREDGRENRAHDPRRHKWYRDAERNYNSRYGSKDRYRDEYRQGFIEGYERGYREGRYR